MACPVSRVTTYDVATGGAGGATGSTGAATCRTGAATGSTGGAWTTGSMAPRHGAGDGTAGPRARAERSRRATGRPTATGPPTHAVWRAVHHDGPRCVIVPSLATARRAPRLKRHHNQRPHTGNQVTDRHHRGADDGAPQAGRAGRLDPRGTKEVIHGITNLTVSGAAARHTAAPDPGLPRRPTSRTETSPSSHGLLSARVRTVR